MHGGSHPRSALPEPVDYGTSLICPSAPLTRSAIRLSDYETARVHSPKSRQLLTENHRFSTKRIPKNRPDSPVFTRKFAPQPLFVPLNFEERIPADRPPRPRSFPGGRRPQVRASFPQGLPSRKGVLPARNFEERMLPYGSRSAIRNRRPSITDRQFMVFSSCSFVYLVVKLCSPQEPFEPYLNYFGSDDARPVQCCAIAKHSRRERGRRSNVSRRTSPTHNHRSAIRISHHLGVLRALRG